MSWDGDDAPSLARSLGLFLVLAILANGVAAADGFSERMLRGTFTLAAFVHVGFAVQDGRFGRWRTLTWLCLLLLWTGQEVAAFLGYVMPWGQVKLWLAAQVPQSEAVMTWFGTRTGVAVVGFAASPIPLFLALAADLIAMHSSDLRQRWVVWSAFILCAALLTGIVTGLGLGMIPQLKTLPALVTRPQIIPDWQLLPYFALLRAVPQKLYGVATLFAALVVPMAWPWMRAYRFRVGGLRFLWAVLCLLLAAAWVGLGVLGSRKAGDATMHWTWVLGGYYFAFFLVIPIVLGLFVPVRQDRFVPNYRR